MLALLRGSGIHCRRKRIRKQARTGPVSARRRPRLSSAHSMALSQKLELRQSQALVMTPQLMQAIKLLQLSNLDLAAYVEAELEQNPLLERIDDPERPRAGDEASPAAESSEAPDGAQPSGDDERAAEPLDADPSDRGSQ